MFSSSMGGKKPVQQVSNILLLTWKDKTDRSYLFVGDGTGWSVLPPPYITLSE
jgi:hypothetical protein